MKEALTMDQIIEAEERREAKDKAANRAGRSADYWRKRALKAEADQANFREAARKILHWYDMDNDSLANMANTAEIFKNLRALLKEPE